MKFKKVSAKSCGKTILTGEHIVVYGYPAVLLPLNIFTTCILSEIKPNLEERNKIFISALNERLEIDYKDLSKLAISKSSTFLNNKLNVVLSSLQFIFEYYGIESFPSFSLKLISNICPKLLILLNSYFPSR